MNRSFYVYGIFFLGLSIACGFFQSLIQFQLGNQLYYLQPFADWFLVINIVSLIGTGYILMDLYIRKYFIALSAGVLATLLLFCQLALIYFMLLWVKRELQPYYILLLFLSLGASCLFALSLVFSRAAKQYWLKAGGAAMFVMAAITLAALSWRMLVADVAPGGPYEKLEQFILAANNFVPLFFILHFRAGLSSAEQPAVLPAARQQPWEGLIGLAGIVSLVAVLYFGSRIAHETIWSLDWRKKGPASAQQAAKAFEARTYVSSKGDTMRYLLMKPLNYDPAKKYPLVICLHGGPLPVTTDRNKHVEVAEPAPLLSQQANREKYPAFLFVPQGPPGYSWGGVPNFPAADSLVFEVIQELEAAFAIDEKRRYVAGGSGGGYGSWYFIGTRPEMFAAAIPFCGAGNTALAPKMVDIPVWAFHGRKDRNVAVSGSREMVAAIRKAGGNPRYTEFSDAGHNVWPHILKTPGLLDWLFAQKRD